MRLVFLAIAVIVLLVASTAVFAAGGAYIDDITLTNNGTTALTDGFENPVFYGGSFYDSSFQGSGVDASSQILHSGSQAAHLGTTSPMVLSLANYSVNGPLDASFWLYMPSAAQQNGWGSYKLRLFSNKGAIETGVSLSSGGSAYYMTGSWDWGDTLATTIYGNTSTATTVISPESWYNVRLHLDNASSMASVFLNGQQQLSWSYNPTYFSSVGVGFYGLMYSSPTPEPSSLLALLCGAGGLAALVRRRR